MAIFRWRGINETRTSLSQCFWIFSLISKNPVFKLRFLKKGVLEFDFQLFEHLNLLFTIWDLFFVSVGISLQIWFTAVNFPTVILTQKKRSKQKRSQCPGNMKVVYTSYYNYKRNRQMNHQKPHKRKFSESCAQITKRQVNHKCNATCNQNMQKCVHWNNIKNSIHYYSELGWQK